MFERSDKLGFVGRVRINGTHKPVGRGLAPAEKTVAFLEFSKFTQA